MKSKMESFSLKNKLSALTSVIADEQMSNALIHSRSLLLLKCATVNEQIMTLTVVLCCSNTEVTYVYQGHSATGSLRLAPVSPEQGMK